jgi:hypothetical protein
MGAHIDSPSPVLQKCKKPAVKPEGFTEYSRRQSPRFLRAPPPVDRPTNHPTLKPSQNLSAGDSVDGMKRQVAANGLAFKFGKDPCALSGRIVLGGWPTGGAARKRRGLCRRLKPGEKAAGSGLDWTNRWLINPP